VKIVFWHRELPARGESRSGTHCRSQQQSRSRNARASCRDELWDQCYRELMANAENRLVHEVTRLGGPFAHVDDETINPKHVEAAGEAWAPRPIQLHVVPAPAGIVISGPCSS